MTQNTIHPECTLIHELHFYRHSFSINPHGHTTPVRGSACHRGFFPAARLESGGGAISYTGGHMKDNGGI